MLNCSGILQLTLDHLIDYNCNLCKFGIPQLSRAVGNRTSTDKIDLLVRFKGRLDCFVHDLFCISRIMFRFSFYATSFD